MAAVANITLNDALATPVLHTFVPVGQDSKGVWWYEDQSASSPIGYNRISYEFVRPTNPAPGESSGNRMFRIKIGFHTPKLETLGNNSSGITPPPTVAYVARCNCEFLVPERSALQDRKDIRKYMDFLLAEAQLTDMVENLRNVY